MVYQLICGASALIFTALGLFMVMAGCYGFSQPKVTGGAINKTFALAASALAVAAAFAYAGGL